MFSNHPPTPTAILTLEILGRGPRQVQNKVQLIISILRLYRVGSIKHISYKMYTKSIIDFGFGSVGTIEVLAPSEKYVIKNEDVAQFKEFFNLMIDHVPKNFDEFTDSDVNHLSTAYKRYCDFLLGSNSDEKKITNLVMGLESLFLKVEEKQELSFRLKMRIAKMLSNFGFNPKEVKKIIAKAYDLRSLYVHGGHISYKERTELEEKFDNVSQFIKTLSNYLRISILIFILIGISKIEFLDKIDYSFIDKDENNRFEILTKSINNTLKIIE